MPQYTLTLKTYQRTVHGKIRLCGIISTKDGQVLQEELDKPTLKELSNALRKGGYIPTSLKIMKKDHVEFQYQSNEMPTAKKQERTMSANNFINKISLNVNDLRLSDKAFRAFIRKTLPIVIFDGCEKT